MYFPKVSVMIFTYNQEDLIAETIESVLNQNYSNFEIVVADDASTDNTASIIKGFEDEYPGKVIGVYNKCNLGITGNSNAAFFRCSGELVAILGGDDLFLPNKIKEQVKLFTDPAVTLSYHPVEIFLHQTGETLFVTNTTENEKLNSAYDIIAKGGIPGASSVMVRRSACPSYGFDPKFPVVADWLFYVEVALKGKVKQLDGVYGKYRKHGRGASDRTYELLDESLKTLEILKERNPTDEALHHACTMGGERYILGEAFRQVMKKDSTKLRSLTTYLLRNSSRLRGVAFSLVLYVISLPFILSMAAHILGPLKNSLKRGY